jgi:hypothetical protein
MRAMSAKKNPKNPRTEPDTGPDEDRVRLRPLLGIRPGIYLSGLYGFIILLILFLLFVLPGVVNPGSVLAVSTDPFGAAVRIDGVYIDASPCEVFISSGKHKVEIVMPGFSPWENEIEVKGRLLGSRFFPRKIPVSVELASPDPAAAFNAEAADFAAWTLAGEPTAAWQVPLSLSEGAYRLGKAASDPGIRSAMNDTLMEALGFGTTRAALRDLLRAKFLLDNQGLSPSPVTLLRSAEDILTMLGETGGSALWLAGILQNENASAVAGSAWYNSQSEAAAFGGNGGFEPVSPAAGRTVTVGELVFREIPGGALAETFYIAETEITNAAWDRFLGERPEWNRENAPALAEKGLVTSDYLVAASLTGAPESTGPGGLPAGISWYAAAAFCEWFGSRLPPEWSGWEIRLPTEAEWEYACKTGINMLGVYWEWCGNPYIPLNFFKESSTTADFSTPERPVRGGAWLNPSNSVDAGTRGSLSPESCSPFVSFRPVLSPPGAK